MIKEFFKDYPYSILSHKRKDPKQDKTQARILKYTY
jgi:hypothetical protein